MIQYDIPNLTQDQINFIIKKQEYVEFSNTTVYGIITKELNIFDEYECYFSTINIDGSAEIFNIKDNEIDHSTWEYIDSHSIVREIYNNQDTILTHEEYLMDAVK